MPNENTWSSNAESQNNNSDDADVGEVNDTTSVEEEDYEASNEVTNEDSGDETELETGFSESDFNEYLQGWAEMLEEELLRKEM
ncbi:150_t:CDS:1, partial [Paraglomus occultum]